MAKTLKKNMQGYGYKYTDIAGIHEYLESEGLSYYQYVETDQTTGRDYVMTVKVGADGKESSPLRGAEIIQPEEKNPTQAYGKGLTYARRYSLLLAYGLATTDDDAMLSTDAPQEKPSKKSGKEYKPAPKKTDDPTAVYEPKIQALEAFNPERAAQCREWVKEQVAAGTPSGEIMEVLQKAVESEARHGG